MVWSYEALDNLIIDNRYNLRFICARFENPDIVLKKKAKQLGIDFLVEENINNISFIKKLKKYNCDSFISCLLIKFSREKHINPKIGTIILMQENYPLIEAETFTIGL